MFSYVVFPFLLILSNSFCRGYFVTVDAYDEECFFEKVEKGEKLGLIYEISGGFRDIDIIIIGPDAKIIHQGNRETSGKYTFVAHKPGKYLYCFSNKMSTLTPKIVMFHLKISEPEAAENKELGAETDRNDLDEMIKQLDNMLKSIKQEQDYMRVRDRVHKEINELTDLIVLWWSIDNCTILLVMFEAHVWYIRRLFSRRRMV